MRHYLPPINDRKIRFALAGCGRIAKNHFDALRQYLDCAEIVGVCDIDRNALDQAATETQAKAYTKLADMLNDTNADIVVLTTPSGIHSKQAIEVAASGRNVMTEKPMATRWHDGLRMVKACDKANVHLFVVKQNRRNLPLQLLKKAIDQNRFGKIYLVNINVFWTRPQEYYDSANWRGTWEFDGGAFMNQASHYIDLLNWLIGPIESVQAYMGTLARRIEVEDSGVMSLRWRSGALGSVNVTMLTYPKNLEGSITILGEKGTVRIGGVAVNEIQLWDFQEPNELDKEIQQANYATTSVYGFGHKLYYENVIQVLRGQASPETDGREGLKSLEVLVAAYLSARDGKRIALPFGLLNMSLTIHPTAIVDEGAQIGDESRIWHWTHICSGARIGKGCSLGQNVFVGNDVVIGNNVKIQNNVSIYDAICLEDDVFCGPSMVFTNVYNPRSAIVRKNEYRQTMVRRGATLGANCTIVCGVSIGEYAFIGAGAVVNRDVKPYELVMGVPAKHHGWMCRCAVRLKGSGEIHCDCGAVYQVSEEGCTLL